jgi:uncharacterized protein YciI
VPRTGGVILAVADSKEELSSILAKDPFYKANVAHYEITEFVPSKYSDNFSDIGAFI